MYINTKKLLSVVLFVCITMYSYAADIYVSSTGNNIDNDGLSLDSPFATINHAYNIAKANSENDIIIINGEVALTGQITLNDTSGFSISFLSADDGYGGTQAIINNGDNNNRLFFANASSSAAITIFTGLEFENISNAIGQGSFFGSNNPSDITFNDCKFTNLTSAIPVTDPVNISDNAHGNISIINTTMTFENCVFDSNTTLNGSGGVFFVGTNGNLIVTDCLFTGNSAVRPNAGSANGGAISIAGTGGTTITNTTFFNNSSGFQGGAVFIANSASQSRLTNVTMFGNTCFNDSDDRGGAFRSESLTPVLIENSLFYGNHINDAGELKSSDVGFGGNLSGATFTNVLVGVYRAPVTENFVNNASKLDAFLDSSELKYSNVSGKVKYEVAISGESPIDFGSDGNDAGAWDSGLVQPENDYYRWIKLPVEVLGAEGVIKERRFIIDEDQLANADKIWLQVNNLGYEDKAALKINDNDWVNWNHQTVSISSPEKERGGMAHGGYSTIRFTIPASGLKIGDNKLSFKFNASNAIANGYRVVDFNLIDNEGNKILGSDYFYEDNPLDWKSPYYEDGAEPVDLETKINQGKNLWYYGRNGTPSQEGEPLISNYLKEGTKGQWYGYELGGQAPIKAKCTSCHVHDGRDLEIFSYSNLSIIERSKFHGLTQEEGELIASYIRSLSGEDPSSGQIGRYGRPWNPPYQPGPQLAGQPIEKWAAGAGLEAVLENDEEMLPYLFPEGTEQEAINTVYDSEIDADQTLLPLAIQFPDWKHWLPMIHPMDAFSVDDYWEDELIDYSPKRGYREFRTFLEANKEKYSSGNITIEEANDLMDANTDFWKEYRFFLAQGAEGGIGNHWRTEGGTAQTKLADGVPREFAATSLARLMAVQFFEIMNEFEFQDKAHWFTENPEEDHPAERQWFGQMYQVFEIPAHFQASVDKPSDGSSGNYFYGQAIETGQFESTNWYELQSVINGGNAMNSHNSPVDYNYQPMFILRASKSSGIKESLRYYHALNEMYQVKTWSGGKNPNDGKGFRIRVMGPWHFYGMTFRNNFEKFQPGEFFASLEDVESGLSVKILNAQLTQFVEEIEDGDVNTDDNMYNQGINKLYNLDGSIYWERGDSNGDMSNKLDLREVTTDDLLIGQDLLNNNEVNHWVDKMYYLIPIFEELGVDYNILMRVYNWSKAAWPFVNWSVIEPEDSLSTAVIEQSKFKVVIDSNNKTLSLIGPTDLIDGIEIYTMTGGLIVKSKSPKTIDIRNLKQGVYVLKAIGSIQQTTMFVLNK